MSNGDNAEIFMAPCQTLHIKATRASLNSVSCIESLKVYCLLKIKNITFSFID